jgi:hypothetical protein
LSRWYWPKATPSLVKQHLIGAKAAAALAKQRIGSPSGICYDSGEHLL